MKKGTARKISKALHTIVVLTMVLQPIGTPSILRAIAADEPTIEATSAPTPKEEPKTEPTAPVAPKEEPAPTPAPESVIAPVAEPKIDPTPAIQVPAPVEAPAPANSISTDATSAPSNTSAIDNTSSKASGTISPEAAATDQDTTEKNGQICLNSGAEINDSTKSDWDVNGEIAETKGKVEVGVKYIFPGNDKVSVTFSCLPAKSDDRATLKIQEIKASEVKLPEGVSAASEFAYDITTGMKDGDFEYDLTFPKAENSNADMNYIKKTASEVQNQELSASDLKPIENSKIKEENSQMKVSALDHFCVYIPTYCDKGSITIVKDAQPNDSQDFSFATSGNGLSGFSLDDDSDHTLSNTKTFSDLSAGSYSVTEGTTNGWMLDDINCTSGGTKDLYHRKANINLAAGKDVTCTFINKKQSGTLTVKKILVPSSDPGLFNLKIDGTTYAANVGDGGTTGAKSVSTGNHTVSETAGTGTSLSGYTTVFGGACSCSGNVNIGAGENKICTITNTRDKGLLRAQKIVDDGSDLTQWSFKMDNGAFVHANSNGLVDFGQVTTLKTHIIIEQGPSSYSFVSISGANCTQNSDNSASATVTKGGTTTCTFSNAIKKGSITVTKVADPKSAQLFNFTTTGSGLSGFALDDDGDNSDGIKNTQLFKDLFPGSYSVTELTPLGWDLSLTCSSNLSGFNYAPINSTTSFSLRAGENVECLYTNTKKSTLKVHKIVLNHGLTNDATHFAPYKVDDTTVTLDTPTFFDPGTHVVTEKIDPNYTQTFSDACDAKGNVTLSPGEDKICTITNEDKVAHLTVIKSVVPSTDNGKFNLQIDGNTKATDVGDGGTTNAVTLDRGQHVVSELAGTNTNLSDYISVIGGDCDMQGNVTLNPGDNKFCTITNTKRGHIIVDKVTDPVNDQQAFIFTTSGVGYNGFSLRDQDIPNDQELSEGTYSVAENIVAGWELTKTSCTSDFAGNNDGIEDISAIDPANINLRPGESVTCIFNNTFTLPKLQIEKSNNKFPVDQHPGDDVTYTLIVTALDNNVNDVHVADLPPNGFKYRGGSWTAHSSVRGDIKNSPTTEPTYHSPGDWKLGDMAKDEVVTLTYMTDISSTQDSGLYPDLAWTQGVDAQNGQVLGAGTNSNFVQDAFVGTKVSVVKAGTVKPASVKIKKNTKTDHKKKKIKRVNNVLPATGANGTWPIVALILLVTGISLLFYDRKRKEKSAKKSLIKYVMNMLLAITFGISLILGSYHVQAGTLSNLAARMEDPKTPVNTSSFLLGFVALDRAGSAVTIQCFKKGPADAGFFQFQTLNLIAGGTSGDCAIDPSVVPSDGTYQFHITTTAGSESVTSNNVSVEVLTGGPGTPTNYQRTKVSDCENNIKTTTADDGGKTVRVEIYRSTQTTFTVDAGTLVKSIDVGSNQTVNYTDTVTNCGSTYYYAARAFDALGNGSGVVADERTVIRTTGGGTRTVTTTVTGGGAIPVSGGTVGGVTAAGGANGAQGGTVEGAQNPSESAGQASGGEQPGQVLGEQTKNEAAASGFGKHPYLYTLLGLVVIYLAYYGFNKYRPKKPESK